MAQQGRASFSGYVGTEGKPFRESDVMDHEMRMLSGADSYWFFRMGSAMMFHTTLGKVGMFAMIQINIYVLATLSLITSRFINVFIEQEIEAFTVAKSRAYFAAMVFSLVLSVMYILVSSVVVDYIRNRLGSSNDVTQGFG